MSAYSISPSGLSGKIASALTRLSPGGKMVGSFAISGSMKGKAASLGVANDPLLTNSAFSSDVPETTISFASFVPPGPRA